MSQFRRTVPGALAVAALLSVSACAFARPSVAHVPAAKRSFALTTGGYRVSLAAGKSSIVVTRKGMKGRLTIEELAGNARINLLHTVTSVKRSGSTYTVASRSTWATASLAISAPVDTPGLLHWTLTVKPTKHFPSVPRLLPDVRLDGAPESSLLLYSPAPPVAGTSLLLSAGTMKTSILYFANLTTLGQFFDRTKSGGSRSNFTYPRARTDGSLVGEFGSSFGYEPPPSSMDGLPRGKATRVIDSYLYLRPSVPAGEAAISAAYLDMLGTVYGHLRKPSVPAANWTALAAKAATDLGDPSNWVTVGGHRYLVSYVSDTRTSPELITQAGVLAGIMAYEKAASVTVPYAADLEANLATFYDPVFHAVKDGLGHDPAAREESWYFIQNLISLLQLAQLGSAPAKTVLLHSIDSAVQLGHVNNYEFPQNFPFSSYNGKDTGLQPDVAGGYAWLMLGMYDLTHEDRYLAEAKASIAHVAGKGFGLAYELQMTAYTAAAAQRLFSMTHDATYAGYAHLALANFFQSTRLWDCTYGLCRTGAGYHTVFGVNILPWGNYVAMLEQYESWLALRDYNTYAAGESAPLLALVTDFLHYTPAMMQYALPPQLPAGTVPASPGLYDFVSHNHLDWQVPVEDLRTGETPSGTIGQEIYGAGGTFMFAAYPAP